MHEFDMNIDTLSMLSDSIDEGVILCKKRTLDILYINPQCLMLIGWENDAMPAKLVSLFEKEQIDAILDGKKINLKVLGNDLSLSGVKTDPYLLIILKDLTKMSRIMRNTEELKRLNIELQNVLEQYPDASIYITDSTGRTLFVQDTTINSCGVNYRDIINRNVSDIEKEGIFYPSVSVKVLQSKTSEVILQSTKIGKTLVALGIPLFDENNNLAKVLSITRDYSQYINIGKSLAHLACDAAKDAYDRESPQNIVTCSNKMLNIILLAKTVAPTNSTVLLTGETGTGKGVFADLIHRTSLRSGKPFIKVNCGAISPTIIESELFGYEPGSFTGARREGKAGLLEAADGGTLFLDEIGELPYLQQVKLLQVLQDHHITRVGGTKQIQVDVRIIAATNRNLEQQVAEGTFREDLYYRLNVVPINIPPLRERKEDIPLLLNHFLMKFNIMHNTSKELDKKVIELLCNYAWPGNVRELENTVERLVVTVETPYIEVENLPETIVKRVHETANNIEIREIIKLDDAVAQIERRLLIMALKEGRSEAQAAEILGISQSTVSRKMKKYGLA